MNSRHQFQCASRWLSVSIVRHRTSGSPTLFAETQPTLGDVRQHQGAGRLALAEDINLGAPGCGVAPVLAVLVDVAALVLPDDDL
jgi:hypothetical protein